MRVARYRPAAGACAASLVTMPASGEHHPAFEEYCECIFELDEDDVAVIQARIAERLQVSRPAVSEMIRRLEAEGLITTDGAIRLTPAGPGAGATGRAPSPTRRAVPHRHARSVVGRRAPRGRQVGARHERRGRAGDGPRARQPDDVPARQPDPRVAVPRAGPRAARPTSSVGESFTSIASPRSWSSRPACSTSSRTPASCPAAAA